MDSGTVAATVASEEAAYGHSGHKAAVTRAHFGQQYQQYFSPQWFADLTWKVAYFVHHLSDTQQYYRALQAVDPTCGTARLLVPFVKNGHDVLGIELDSRLVKVAQEALGNSDKVRAGDLLLYGDMLPDSTINVMALNPPYGPWWNVEGTPYEEWELVNKQYNIEAQAFCIELAKHKLSRYGHGLLAALISDNFLRTQPLVNRFLHKHFHVFCNLSVPAPYEAEYGIKVNARLIYAVRRYTEDEKTHPGCLEGVWSEGVELLAPEIAKAFKKVRATYEGGTRINWSQGQWSGHHLLRRNIPHLDLTKSWEHGEAKIQITERGLRTADDWSKQWLRFYSMVPIQDFSPAIGTDTQLDEAIGSLPNILINGPDETTKRLAALGFDVELNDTHRAKLAQRAERYQIDRLPIRELGPHELLGWITDGEQEALEDGVLLIPEDKERQLPEERLAIQKGKKYKVFVRWTRVDKVANTKRVEAEKKAKSYTWSEHVDAGYLVINVYDPANPSTVIRIREDNLDLVEEYIKLFGLPHVPLVDELPQFPGIVRTLTRLSEERQNIAGGKKLYPIQALDVARMATKQNAALLYEQGGGKTSTIAHWAMLKGFRSVLVVTPAQVVGGIIEDLQDKWGIPCKRLTHGAVTEMRAKRHARKWARHQVKVALAHIANGKATQAELDLVAWDGHRLRLERQYASKRRHHKNLLQLEAKGKVKKSNRERWNKEHTGVMLDIQAIMAKLHRCYDALGYKWDRPALYTEWSSNGNIPDVYVASYQDISLGDHVGVFDPWDHEHYDREDRYVTTIKGNRGSECAGCKTRRSAVVDLRCPKCGKKWRGRAGYGPRYCRSCGYRPWTMGAYPVEPEPEGPMTRELVRERTAWRKKLRLQGGAEEDGPLAKTYHQWPVYRRCMRHLFGAVILDEAQDAKGRSSLRGTAARAFRSNGRGVLTGTWMKGYIFDLFFTAGWLAGFGSPLWPYRYDGGSAQFLKKFGTFTYVTKQFADTLEVGRRKLIPSVSNLNFLWRLLAPISIRRLKEDFLKDLPPKNVETHFLHLEAYNEQHAEIVSSVMGWVSDVCKRELRKANPNMAAISGAMWCGRYATSCPNKYGALKYARAFGHKINAESDDQVRKAVLAEMYANGQYLLPQPGYDVAIDYAQITRAIELIEEAKDKGEKVIVFTSLRGMYATMKVALDAHLIRYHEIGNTPTGKRNDVVRAFEASSATVLLSGTKKLNRGITAVGANHVIILNMEWSPEDTLQAEDRIHRPGQEKECYVHYVLAGNESMDEQMDSLVTAKLKAQQSVQDRTAQHLDVAQMLEQAAQTDAKLAVARELSKQLWDEARMTTFKRAKRKKILPPPTQTGGQMGLFTVSKEGEVATWEAKIATNPTIVEVKGGGSQMSMFEVGT